MCGIAGFYNLKSDNRENIGKMLEKISHRGPDGSGVWDDGCYQGVVLGHTRLAIIDLTDTGTQPMVSHSERFVITYNGEIYNASGILSDMRNSGYTDTMRGTSDTEILIEACEFYGIKEAIARFRGMFAFALYDRQEKILTLARDRIGEKPLYYGFVGEAFVFASEIGAIRALDGFSADINKQVLPIYLKYGYIPAPFSIYENIWKLEPGSLLKIKCGLDNYKNINPYKYWKIDEIATKGQQTLFKGSRSEAADELERLLKISVQGQMISDVDLGAFLSAGIDSSTIVSLMQSVADKPVRTFTIGFEEAEYNEADAATLIAKHLGTDHTVLTATEQEALDAVHLMPAMFGEPFGDSSQIPTYLVSRLTKKHVTVALSGDGGDELFAGYRDYAGVYSIYNKICGIPYPVRNAAGGLMEHFPGQAERSRRIRAHGTLLRANGTADLYERTYETWPGLSKLLKEPDEYVHKGTIRSRRCPARYSADPASAASVGKMDDYTRQDSYEDIFPGDPVHTAMLMNMQMYHPDDILVKVDRTAMAVSLETRVPMLDADVVEFAWSLPLEYVFDGKKGKLVLRDVLHRYVPEELTDRPKQGFGVPVARWIRDGKLRKWADDLFNPELINRHDLLSADAAINMWRAYTDQGIWRPQIWYVLMLNAWLDAN